MTSSAEVRVRVAPSPTGDPHVGTAYVALFNMVLARKYGGKFILRIEDTDQARYRADSERMITESLNWLGLVWDEGPDVGGEFGPYRQSERKEIYQEHVERLIADDKAYHCFCSAERLTQMREQQRKAGETTKYDGHCRNLSSQDVQQYLEDRVTHVVRLKMPSEGSISFEDELRGKLEFNAQQLDDQVLLKSDGLPTYHLANVVDDHLMKISHVMRAEEWISSTPKHVVLYAAFGWPEPKWIHLPLLRNPDKSKISKRKNPVSLNFYKRAGFLPEAVRNYLSLMGWSFGDDQELFSLQDMIDNFDYKTISLGGPVFEVDKLTWINQHYLHKMNADEFADYVREEVFGVEYLKKLHAVALERLSRFDQFVDNNSFFFNGALDYSNVNAIPKNKTIEEVKKSALVFAEKLDACDDWSVVQIESMLEDVKQTLQLKPRDFFMPMRLIITGRKDSPPLAESIHLIGREMARFRLRDFCQRC
jgi:glutamyl-tRNA synthetase